jgi:hypothetical protein
MLFPKLSKYNNNLQTFLYAHKKTHEKLKLLFPYHLHVYEHIFSVFNIRLNTKIF